MAKPKKIKHYSTISGTIYGGLTSPSLLTLTGPTPPTGTVGTPATGGSVANSGTVSTSWSISSTPPATFSPSSGTLGAGSSVSYTMTALSAAMHTINLQNLSGGSVANNGASFSASPFEAPPPPPAPVSGDWIARSTGPGVVWAHNFEYDEEVDNHLLSGSDTSTAVLPRRVVDESGIGCLEQVILGSTLAEPYAAGSPTMVISNTKFWPDPAVTGPFYFMASEQIPNVGRKNLFICTARSGNVLTVSLYASPVSSVFVRDPVTNLQVAQSYAVGDYVGQESTSEWRRTFAALPAGENGKPTPDPAANGTVPLRSKLTGNALSVPRDNSLWQYGWYGHPSNQSIWANWTGWQGTSSLVPRGISQGADPRFRLWDGDEFWIQFRTRIDPDFWGEHVLPDPNGSDGWWGRKFWALQSELSSLNQLVTGIAPSNRFSIPATRPNPFSLNTYKASRVIGVSDYDRPSGTSYQKGSPWDVPPHYANLSSSFKPATGAPTPDGSAAWEYKDNEWITWLIRVKPGRSGVSETEIEVKFARTEDPAYSGDYTTVLNVTDANITYSGSGDYPFPDGVFSYPEVVTMNALPGYQAFGLMGYLNIAQTVSIPPPKASYYIRMAQVIFSKQSIPAPVSDLAPPLPTWVPAPGEATVLTNTNGGLTNHYRDVVNFYADPFYAVKSAGGFNGAFKNPYWGDYGCTIFWGGGHSDTNHNAVIIAEYGYENVTYKRVADASPYYGDGAGLSGTPLQNVRGSNGIGFIIIDGKASARRTNTGEIYTNPYCESLVGDGAPNAPHSWGSGDVIGPEYGGAPYGTFLQVLSQANTREENVSIFAAHKLEFNTLGHGFGARSWIRDSNNWNADFQPASVPAYTVFVPPQRRIYYVSRAVNREVRWYDMDTKTYEFGTGLGLPMVFGSAPGGNGGGAVFFVPSRNILVLCIGWPTLRVFWMNMNNSNPTMASGGGGEVTLTTPISVENYFSSACWCKDNNKIIVGGLAAQNTIGEISIPTVLTDPWPSEVVSTTPGILPFPLSESDKASVFKKWSYDEKVKAIVYQKSATRTGDDTVYVYRPRGT